MSIKGLKYEEVLDTHFQEKSLERTFLDHDSKNKMDRSVFVYMSIGFTVVVGDALFFSVPEGELYFLVNKFKSKEGVHIQVLFHPNESLIRGVIKTFFIKHSDLPLSYQRLIKTPIIFLQHFLFKKTEAKAFRGQTLRCPGILETSVGNFQLFYLEETVEREKFSMRELRGYFNTDEINQDRKFLLNEQKIPKAE